MKASWGIVRCCCCIGLLGNFAIAAEMSIVPIGASGPHSIVGNVITLQGGGQRVFLELQIEGWSPGLLQAWQAVIDSEGYSSGTLGVITPASLSCTEDADCETAFGAGARCSVPVGSPVRCSPGFIDNSRSNYIFLSEADLFVVDISTLSYRFGGVVLFGSVMDPEIVQYAGTLVLQVPASATGTFTVGFTSPVCAGGDNNGQPCDPNDANSCLGGFCQVDNSLQDINSNLIAPLDLTPAIIAIECQTSSDAQVDLCDHARFVEW